MAYDKEDKEPDQYSPKELQRQEEKYSGKRSEIADRLGFGKGRELRERGQAAEAAEAEALQERLDKTLKEAQEEDGNEDSGFFKNEDGKGSGKAQAGKSPLKRLLKNKKLLAGAGSGFIGLILGAAALFNFLGTFKLEHLLNNIDAKSFGRYNAVFSHRSDKWVRAYITIRLSEFDGSVTRGPDDNLYFRSNKVDTNNPIRDWYRTLRSNKFEERVLNKKGIFFTAVDGPGGKVGYVKIQVGNASKIAEVNTTGTPFIKLPSTEQNKILQRIDTFSTELFEGPGADKAMRNEVKKVVKEETRFFQVVRRRHLRKDIQNKIGVGDWKFFEKTRNKITAKKKLIQKKLLVRLLPEDTKSGKFILCIFGAGECPKNADTLNKENKSARAFASGQTAPDGQQTQLDANGKPVLDANGDPVLIDTGANPASKDIVQEAINVTDQAAETATSTTLRTELLKKILEKINIVTSVLSVVNTLDMLSRIDSNIINHKLSQLAVLAKGAQAMAAYTTYSIASDQSHSGELTADEYNVLLNSLKGSENSEAHDYFFNQSKGTVAAASSKNEFCADTHVPVKGEFYWNCDSTKVGGTTNGSKIETAYINGFGGQILHPLIQDYHSVRNAPVIGFVFDAVSWLSDKVSSLVAKIIDPIFAALGITGTITKFMAWVTEKVIAFLGAGPILTGFDDLAGLTLTMIGQGSAVTAENGMREAGAAVSTPVTKAYGEEVATTYHDEQEASRSFADRYLSTQNPDSVASQTLYGLSNLSFAKLGSLSHWFSGLGGGFGSLFGHRASAASFSGAAPFAGIDTYDFPQYCVDRDPLTSYMPQDLTNADTLINASGQPFLDPNDITMELLDNHDAFWDKVYERVGNNDTDPKTVLQIYNCENLDQRVRGSMGYTSGYTNDGGLESGIAILQSNGSPTPSAPPVVTPGTFTGTDIPGQDTSAVPCPASPTITTGSVADGYRNGTLYKIRLCSVHGVQLNAIYAKNFDDFFTAGETAGHNFKGSAGFRTMAGQISLRNAYCGNDPAKLYVPGTCSGATPASAAGWSNHQFGIATDLACDGVSLFGGAKGTAAFEAATLKYPCLAWIRQNSPRFGLVLQCDGRNAQGLVINGLKCESWHLSPTGG